MGRQVFHRWIAGQRLAQKECCSQAPVSNMGYRTWCGGRSGAARLATQALHFRAEVGLDPGHILREVALQGREPDACQAEVREERQNNYVQPDKT